MPALKRFGVCTEHVSAPHQDCPICLSTLAGRHVLRLEPCGHRFHAACVRRWATTQRTCPCCRSAF